MYEGPEAESEPHHARVELNLDNEEKPIFLQPRMTEEDYETKNAMLYDQRFLDKVRVWAFGGNGGAGSVAMNRESY